MNNLKNKYLLIIDYNLTRYDDVKLIAEYAKSKYDLQTILIRPNPSVIDKTITPLVINLEPRAENFIQEAKKHLAPYRSKIVAGLSFSDNAVYKGAMLLEELGLETDSATHAEAAYSKIVYRQVESAYKSLWSSQSVYVPKFKIVTELREIIAFAHDHPNGFILKPSCEGNNRGVMMLKQGDDLKVALEQVQPYIHAGIICEELIDFEEEYSVDGLGHLQFYTEKLSVRGKYPVEYGQIIGSHIPGWKVGLLSHAGKVANLIVGQAIGPYHNEVKLSLKLKQSAIIEPNRRPAGMRIWSLAEKVYGVNFYHLWIDRLIAKTSPAILPQAIGSAGIRMLGTPYDGVLQLPSHIERNPLILFHQALDIFSKKYPQALDWFEFRLNKKSGDQLVSLPRDNSDFIAQVCLYVNNSTEIKTILNELHECWLKNISRYIRTMKGEVA